MAKYAKAIIATLTALGTWGTTVFADGELNAIETFGLTGVVVSGLLVYAYPNADTINVNRDEAGRFAPKDDA